MDFRFLGPLEVRSAGIPLPLGGQKQRGVLAVLLLNANNTVSVDRLVDDVWGAAPPRTVEAYVQNCVSRLRAVLGHETIETHAGGYLLRVDPEDVDAMRFVRAIEAAPSLEAPERVAALGEALDLWRGQPLAEFAYDPFAQPEIARLEELRLAATEGRLEALIELGSHGIALPELEALSARHPARERLRYLQMLALYRSGRQHDALVAYQDARRELGERFGLDPSEELRALERMILQQDPSLRPPAPAADAAAPGRGARVVLVAQPGGELVESLVRSSGGVVRPQGETVVGVYGAERRRDDDALRALRAAAEIQRSVGSVCVAVDRVEDVDRDGLDRDLLAHVGPGETVAGSGVLQLVAHAVDVVGHSGGGYRVLHVDDDADALPRRFDAQLVGRRPELARLEADLERVTAEQSSRRLVVLGEAGIGKTRLIREFAARSSALVLSARCGRRDADFVGDLIAPLEPVERLLANEPDGGRVAAALRARSTSGWTEEQWTLRRLIESAARIDPVVVILDDLHWAQPHVVDLFDYLAGWVRGPVLVVGLARPELIEARTDLVADALQLGPLSQQESLALASHLPDREALDAELVRRLVENAEGNPLYIEQLVAWSSEGQAAPLPPAIDLLIAMRIERLPPAERRVLERAAVIGTEFWRGGVEAASPEDEIGPALMSLVRRRLVQPAPTPFARDDGFRFHHALIRDVIYSSIPAELRAELHKAVARSLDNAPEHDAVAGRHLEAAATVDTALAEEASKRLAAAGMRALRRIDPLPAVDLLGRASHLIGDGTRKRELEWGVATATKFAGDTVRAEELLEDVAARAADAGDTPNELRARVEQVWPQLARGGLAVADALLLLDQAVAAFAEDDFALARAWDVRASVHGVYLLQAAACEQAEQRARAHYQRVGATTGAADVRLAGAAWFGPTPVPVAIARCRQILAASETPVWASFVQPFLAGLLAMEGRFAEARAVLEAARQARAEFADPRTLDTSWAYFAAELEVRAGDLEAAERILSDALGRLRDGANSEWTATQTAILGEVFLRRGDDVAALSASETARGLVSPEHLTVLSIAERVRAAALARLGRIEEAHAVAQGIVQALAASDALVDQARALLAHAHVLEQAGERPQARDARANALALLERKGDLVTLRSTRPD